MKYLFLNDRSSDLGIHPASCTDKNTLKPEESIEITIPDGMVPFIKVWDFQVLLSYSDKSLPHPLDKG